MTYKKTLQQFSSLYRMAVTAIAAAPTTTPLTATILYVNGRNVMLMPTRDCYTFGLDLLSMLFTTEELSESLVYASTKTEKPKNRYSIYIEFTAFKKGCAANDPIMMRMA